MKTRRFALITMALVSSAAFAGPKAPGSSPPPFVPEIGYTYSGGNSSELRLSNREGTAAVLVHRSNVSGGVQFFDLAPPNVDGNRIAFNEKDASGNKFLKITTWHYDANGSVKVGSPTTLRQFGSASYPHNVRVEFSPDGRKLSYLIATSQYAREIYVHDFTTGATELLTKIDSNGGVNLAWHANGSHLYYDGTITKNGRRVFRLPTNQGFQSSGEIIIERPEIHIRQLEVSRPNSTQYAPGLFVNYSDVDGLVKVAYYADDGVTLGAPQILLAKDGSPLPASLPHLNCAGSEMIHEMTNTRNLDKGMYNTTTRNVVKWSTDRSIGRTDWMPCALN